MAEIYRRTQMAYAILIPIDVIVIVCIYLGITTQMPVYLLVAVGLAIAGSLFFGLTVVGTEDTLRIAFGVGLIKREFKIAEMLSVRPYRTAFWQGWGIHRCSDGTIYNVSGFEAIQLTMLDGKKYIIGTNDQRRLLTYIEERRHHTL
jgi:hypothetical protein